MLHNNIVRLVEILYKRIWERLLPGVALRLLGSHGLLGDDLLLVLPHQLPPLLHFLSLHLPLGLLLGLQLSVSRTQYLPDDTL